MLEQPNSPTASETKKQVFDHYLYRLQSEVHAIIASEQAYEERVKPLESELSVFKQACVNADAEKRLLEEKLDKLESQLQVTASKRIVCLIDGNSTILEPELIRKGRDGGRLAAKQLTDSVDYHLMHGAPVPCHLWTYVFFNKYVLMETFSRASAMGGDPQMMRHALDEFVFGFNEACDRFTIIDVGPDKGAAEAKLKAHLDMHAHSPETYKLLFGGCHDNGYIPQLQSLIAAGLSEKLVLLLGFNDMGIDMQKLKLPSLVIPELFLREKIAPGPKSSHAQSHSRQGSFASTPVPQKIVNQNASQNGQNAGQNQPTCAAGLPTPPASDTEQTDSDGESQRGDSPTPHPPMPYHEQRSHSPPSGHIGSCTERTSTDETNALGLGEENGNGTRSISIHPASAEVNHPPSMAYRMITGPRAAPQCVVLANASDPANYRPHSHMPVRPRRLTQSSADFYPSQYDEPKQMGNTNNANASIIVNGYKNVTKQRKLNRDIALSQHSPPPCTLFYLAANGCKHGAECRFGHDYILDDEDYDLLRRNAKKVPCPAANRGEYCVFGDECCYGHYCPQLTNCPYFKRGKCKFTGAGMHRE